MNKIPTSQLFEFYKDTLDNCGTYLLNETEDVIEHKIFEEFDIGIHSFFFIDNLMILRNEGFISEKKMLKSSLLRDKFILIQSSGEWNINSLKTSEKWKEIFQLCDEIKAL